jgi:hypothetical protein
MVLEEGMRWMRTTSCLGQRRRSGRIELEVPFGFLYTDMIFMSRSMVATSLMRRS